MMDLIYKSTDVDQERESAYKWVDNSFLILLKASAQIRSNHFLWNLLHDVRIGFHKMGIAFHCRGTHQYYDSFLSNSNAFS